jgi:hypothetical protein
MYNSLLTLSKNNLETVFCYTYTKSNYPILPLIKFVLYAALSSKKVVSTDSFPARHEAFRKVADDMFIYFAIHAP